MVARLVVEEGDLKGLTLSLDEGEVWTIGRDPDECQLVIEDPLVSRKHLIARRTAEGILIENLSITNPTQVNEELLNQPYLLQNGDVLKIGNELLRYYDDSSTYVHEEAFDPSDIDIEDESIHDRENEILPPEKQGPSPAQAFSQDNPPPPQNTLFGEDDADLGKLAEINFEVIETGRWLLKVIGGPNNGAEFYMQSGHSYVLGTDPQSCDLVFHDTSVSRQHAKITVTPEDTLTIEDLHSRNGVLIGSNPLEGKQALIPNQIVTLGTTSFVVYDREGEMQTIISPLLPSIVKVLQQEIPPLKQPSEQAPVQTETPSTPVSTPSIAPPTENLRPQPSRQIGPYIVLTAIIGLFALAGIGTTTLFKSEPVVMQTHENADELIEEAVKPFPAIRYTFNKGSGGILLLGHVTTLADKNQLLYNLQGLKFIKSIDDAGIVIDEYVWREVNSILDDNPAWEGISIHSPAAGEFVISGYLKTRKQADQLSAYMSLNFPYLDLLKKQIVVEEDVINQINLWLQNAQLTDVVPSMTTGEVTLTGTAPADKSNDVQSVLNKIKNIPGVRIVNNLVKPQTAETGIINISDHYQITGKSRIGDKYTVIINGRILSENDDLDGMTIKKITSDRVFLEKDDTKYRIDY